MRQWLSAFALLMSLNQAFAQEAAQSWSLTFPDQRISLNDEVEKQLQPVAQGTKDSTHCLVIQSDRSPSTRLLNRQLRTRIQALLTWQWLVTHGVDLQRLRLEEREVGEDEFSDSIIVTEDVTRQKTLCRPVPASIPPPAGAAKNNVTLTFDPRSIQPKDFSLDQMQKFLAQHHGQSRLAIAVNGDADEASDLRPLLNQARALYTLYVLGNLNSDISGTTLNWDSTGSEKARTVRLSWQERPTTNVAAEVEAEPTPSPGTSTPVEKTEREIRRLWQAGFAIGQVSPASIVANDVSQTTYSRLRLRAPLAGGIDQSTRVEFFLKRQHFSAHTKGVTGGFSEYQFAAGFHHLLSSLSIQPGWHYGLYYSSIKSNLKPMDMSSKDQLGAYLGCGIAYWLTSRIAIEPEIMFAHRFVKDEGFTTDLGLAFWWSW